MERWLNIRHSIAADPSAVVDVLVAATPEIIQAASGTPLSQPSGDGSVDVQLRGRVAGAVVHKTVRVHFGEVRHLRNWTTIPIRWEADHTSYLFPSFDGMVEVEHLSGRWAELAISGHYRPPLGLVGDLVDRSGLADVATGTLTALLEGIVEEVGRRLHGAAAPTPHRAGAIIVRDVMTADVFAVNEDDTLMQAATSLLVRRVSGAPVLDDTGRVVGVLSTTDLLQRVVDGPTVVGRGDDARTAGEVCTRPALTTEADSALRDAAKVMEEQGVDRLIVMDGATHVGIITRTDTLMSLLRDDDQVEASIREVLVDYELAGIDVAVHAGVARLFGKVELRSDARGAQRVLRDVDGLLAIDDRELDWVVDDVIPIMYPI